MAKYLVRLIVDEAGANQDFTKQTKSRSGNLQGFAIEAPSARAAAEAYMHELRYVGPVIVAVTEVDAHLFKLTGEYTVKDTNK